MKINRIILWIFVLVFTTAGRAQLNDDPFDELSKRMLQNEMLTQRLLRNFVFIKTNTFKAKALKDMDKSLARFDDNMEYFAMHLPEDNDDVEKDFDKLNNFWSLYRLSITDYEKNNYDKLIRKTERFAELMDKFFNAFLPSHDEYHLYKKTVNIALLDVQNIRDVDKIATSYILQNSDDNYKEELNFDFNTINKNLKKIAKYKKTAALTREYVDDLFNSLKMIKATYNQETYNPKMMFSNVAGFSKKSYKILDILLNTIK